MRRAGRLAAEVLDLLVPKWSPASPPPLWTSSPTIHHRPWRPPGLPRLSRLPPHASAPRSIMSSATAFPNDQAAERRRHRQHRRHRDRRRLARRHQPHVFVGEVKRKAERLVEITYEVMMRGIAAVKPGATTGDIGHAIQILCRRPGALLRGARFLRPWPGQGVPRAPNIVHYGRPGQGIALKPGMFFTIEPMINLGGYAREGVERRLDGGDARPFACRRNSNIPSASPRPASRSSPSRPRAGTRRPISDLFT